MSIREKWIDVINYEELYQVSNKGKIRSKDLKLQNSNGAFYIRKGKLLHPTLDSYGYYALCLSKNKQSKRYKLHRLIAIAFIDNPYNKPQINHKDGHKENNHIDNLEWCTCSENVKHAHYMGLR